MLGLLRPQPLLDAVNVETVGALSPNLEEIMLKVIIICLDATDQGTVVSGKFTIGTAAVKSYSADAACVVIGEPLPDSDPRPRADGDLEPGLGPGLLRLLEAAPVLVLLTGADLLQRGAGHLDCVAHAGPGHRGEPRLRLVLNVLFIHNSRARNLVSSVSYRQLQTVTLLINALVLITIS